MNIKRNCWAILALFCLWIVDPATATTIGSSDSSTLLEPLAMSSQDKRFLTALLFDFSPYTANKQTAVAGLADPLGIGADPALSIFDGKVYFMDLLGNFTVSSLGDPAGFDLPPSTLHGINLLDDVNSMYLSYEGRAFDKSLWNLETAEVIERNGLPVTFETSPLSLSGYGSVSEKFNPFNMLWTRCPSQYKREQAMSKSMKQGGAPCSTPGACQCYGL
jgi:hypothetical protein